MGLNAQWAKEPRAGSYEEIAQSSPTLPALSKSSACSLDAEVNMATYLRTSPRFNWTISWVTSSSARSARYRADSERMSGSPVSIMARRAVSCSRSS
jgi:hypothetical protein